jgi:hypothetical protein
MTAAPPRSSLRKFGGSLSLSEFYGLDGSSFKMMHTPPFVTYAMYAELTNSSGTAVENKDVYGLRRPADAGKNRSEQESTEKPPLILEYLARRGALKPATSAKAKVDIKSDRVSATATAADTDPRVSTRGQGQVVEEPPKKRKIAPAPKLDESSIAGGGGLARYLMK